MLTCAVDLVPISAARKGPYLASAALKSSVSCCVHFVRAVDSPCTFLKAYPFWVSEHYHPAALVDGTVCSSHSSAHSPSSQPSESQTPPGPSNTQGQRTVGNRARPAATTVPSRRRRGSPPASSTSPPPTPPGAAAAGQQLPTRTPTPHIPPQAAVYARQHCSPGWVWPQPHQLPLPQSAKLARRTSTSTPPMDTVSTRMHCSPGVGVACQPQSPPATILQAPGSHSTRSSSHSLVQCRGTLSGCYSKRFSAGGPLPSKL
eukprot:Em0007g1201a